MPRSAILLNSSHSFRVTAVMQPQCYLLVPNRPTFVDITINIAMGYITFAFFKLDNMPIPVTDVI
jgi:hypothetical protein